jgi:uncharacterized membrane protein HdeD (DUF308 family)
MNQKYSKNLLMIVIGLILLVIGELKLIHLPEIIMILLTITGFVLVVDGLYRIYKA